MPVEKSFFLDNNLPKVIICPANNALAGVVQVVERQLPKLDTRVRFTSPAYLRSKARTGLIYPDVAGTKRLPLRAKTPYLASIFRCRY